MKSIEVKICTGTACFVMGGGELLQCKDSLPLEIKKRVELKGSPCMGLCRTDCFDQAPLAFVNNKVVPQATVKKIQSAIMEAANAEN